MSDKDKSLKLTLDQIKKQFSKIAVMGMGDQEALGIEMRSCKD